MFHDGFISQLVGRPVVLKELPDQPIGQVADFYVEKPDDTFPRIDAIVIDTRDGRRSAPIASVAEIDRDGKVVLEKVPTAPALPNESAFYIIRDLFDKQIVDVNGRRIVRINDIEVANTTSGPRIVAADVGVSGLMRRLGFGRFAKPLVEHAPRALIAWDHVAPIREINPSEVRLSVSGRRLERLHPS